MEVSGRGHSLSNMTTKRVCVDFLDDVDVDSYGQLIMYE